MRFFDLHDDTMIRFMEMSKGYINKMGFARPQFDYTFYCSIDLVVLQNTVIISDNNSDDISDNFSDVDSIIDEWYYDSSDTK